VALLRRGADKLSGYPAHGPHDVDVAGVRRSCAELAARIEASGTGALRARETDIRLRVPDDLGL
jgi:hypothetical protein